MWAKAGYNLTFAMWLVEDKKVSIDTKDQSGKTALHYAEKNDHGEMINWIQSKQTGNVVNNHQKHVSYYTFWGYPTDAPDGADDGVPQSYFTQIQSWLKTSYQVEVEDSMHQKNNVGKTPLDYATVYAQLEQVQWLEKHDGVVGCSTAGYKTILHRLAMIKLLQLKADKDA